MTQEERELLRGSLSQSRRAGLDPERLLEVARGADILASRVSDADGSATRQEDCRRATGGRTKVRSIEGAG
jgi:hypothetical protein